ncbi:hypothetical protein MQE36_02480 [Zhouia spongiae]|uniref:Gliding motility protein GldL n=1 Tax=Zhouia spongiae TaxID=2202721 RepID=A0ABY3YNN0_9FLAO|nr:hypothetical protein [Zhouia spongiae]UNY99220.1 hypothetical protein MQE36_02480 [Zhouia spongiae]
MIIKILFYITAMIAVLISLSIIRLLIVFGSKMNEFDYGYLTGMVVLLIIFSVISKKLYKLK